MHAGFVQFDCKKRVPQTSPHPKSLAMCERALGCWSALWRGSSPWELIAGPTGNCQSRSRRWEDDRKTASEKSWKQLKERIQCFRQGGVWNQMFVLSLFFFLHTCWLVVLSYWEFSLWYVRVATTSWNWCKRMIQNDMIISTYWISLTCVNLMLLTSHNYNYKVNLRYGWFISYLSNKVRKFVALRKHFLDKQQWVTPANV